MGLYKLQKMSEIREFRIFDQGPFLRPSVPFICRQTSYNDLSDKNIYLLRGPFRNWDPKLIIMVPIRGLTEIDVRVFREFRKFVDKIFTNP